MSIAARHIERLERIRLTKGLESRDMSARAWRDELAQLFGDRKISHAEYVRCVADVERYIGPFFGIRVPPGYD